MSPATHVFEEYAAATQAQLVAELGSLLAVGHDAGLLPDEYVRLTVGLVDVALGRLCQGYVDAGSDAAADIMREAHAFGTSLLEAMGLPPLEQDPVMAERVAAVDDPAEPIFRFDGDGGSSDAPTPARQVLNAAVWAIQKCRSNLMELDPDHFMLEPEPLQAMLECTANLHPSDADARRVLAWMIDNPLFQSHVEMYLDGRDLPVEWDDTDTFGILPARNTEGGSHTFAGG